METTIEVPGIPRELTGVRTAAKPRPFQVSPVWIVVFYAMAMAWVESAVVFYLRTMLNRLEPHQPEPLPLGNGFALAEIVREGATMVMLLTVGWLAGRTWRSRLGYALLAFGVWDIAYYLWLVVLTGWPRSLGDWDILFLIPLPWWGPVWAPMAIAMLMVVFGALVGCGDHPDRPLWPGRAGQAAATVGALLALGVFMADSIRVIGSGGVAQDLRKVLPENFHWALFGVGLTLIALPVVEIVLRAWGWQAIPTRLDADRWLAHFARNQEHRPEPDWNLPLPPLRREVLVPFVHSLEQFRLGDGGGPASLIAFDAPSFVQSSERVRAIVGAWFREEAEHSRLLGNAVRRFGGRIITSHWSFTAFCLCRRALGVRFELQVLTLTELVSTGYYRVLRRHSPDTPVTDMCTLILRDEAGHVAFQRARLQDAGHRGRLGELWRMQFWVLGHAAAAMLWVNHGPCLTALGGSRAEYFREVRKELWRFIRSVESGRRQRSGGTTG